MTSRTKAVGAIILTTLMWSFTTIFVKSLIGAYDSWTQNFFRYFSAMVAILIICAFRRNGSTIPPIRRWGIFILPVCLNLLHQTTWTIPLYYEGLYPGYATILLKTGPIFGAVFGYMFFVEERAHIRSMQFLVGLTAGVLGTVGFIMAGNGRFEGHSIGSIMLVSSAAFWVFYSILLKKIMRTVDPIGAFAVACILTTIGFGVAAVAFGNPTAVFTAGNKYVVIAVLSGIMSIGIGQPIYFYAVKRLGVAVCNTVLLLNVVVTPFVSFFLFGEVLSGFQVFWGLILVAGAVLTIPRE